MFELFLLKAQKIIKKSYINILSWVALGLAILASCSYFIYSYDGKNFFFTIIYLISLLLNIAPYILLVLYLKKFQNRLKATIIVPIIFGLLGLPKILGIGLYYFGGSTLTFIIDIAFIISCILSTISALKGLKKKLFVLIFMGIGVLDELISLTRAFSFIGYYVSSGYITSIFLFARIISAMLLYIDLGFFGIKFKIPAILAISPEKEKITPENVSPEQALMALKNKLELSMITEEEYQKQRAEIISKL